MATSKVNSSFATPQGSSAWLKPMFHGRDALLVGIRGERCEGRSLSPVVPLGAI
jgi:hypothetical protein